jgi:glycoside/pentoside/hexuronide:cation symporter, GPH family
MAKERAGAFHPFSYAALALALAFAGLPLYVHLPQYYAVVHGVSLQALGVVLLLVRLVDTLQDPFIGWLSDKYPYRRKWIGFSIPCLAVSFLMLFHFPGGGVSPSLWLGLWLVITYTSFSIIQINYYALGAEMGTSAAMHTRIAAWREGVMLCGILVAAVLPDALSKASGKEAGFAQFSWMFVLLLLATGALTLKKAPHKPLKRKPENFLPALKSLLGIRKARLLLAFFFFNTLGMAATSTLYLFFINDVIGAEQHGGKILGTYFLMGAIGMPFWTWIARRIGREKAMAIALLLAVVCFVDAYQLSHGAVHAFYVIAVLTGLSLGADMAIPVAMMADLLKSEKLSVSLGFGLWNFISKGNLALAAGITLPLLGMAGYVPESSNSEGALSALRSAYALFPCVMKVVACIILWYGFIKKGRTL